MLLYSLIIFINIWMIYTFQIYGFAQALTSTLIAVFIIATSKKKTNSTNFKVIDLILLSPILLFISNLLSFISYSDISFLARSIYIITPCFLLLVTRKFSWTSSNKAFNFFTLLYIITNLLALLYFSKFDVYQAKFMPAVDWARMTSNEISYYTTLVGILLIAHSYTINRRLKFTIFLVSIFTFIHFSKSHIIILLISIIVSAFIISKVKHKLTIVLIIFLISVILSTMNLENLIYSLDIRPLNKLYYSFNELPDLIEGNGFYQGLLLFTADAGDATRSYIYRNGIENFGLISIYGSAPSLIQNVFHNKDYHNNFLFLSYEYGIIGIIYYFTSTILVLFAAIKVKDRFFKLLILTAFFYFSSRSFFMTVDTIWIIIYWYIIFHLYYFKAYNEST